MISADLFECRNFDGPNLAAAAVSAVLTIVMVILTIVMVAVLISISTIRTTGRVHGPLALLAAAGYISDTCQAY